MLEYWSVKYLFCLIGPFLPWKKWYQVNNSILYHITNQAKFDDKVVQLKEEKMSKFVVASRRRDYIDLPHYFGKHEFSVVPRSMFRQDGSLLLGCDKASVMHQIEELVGEKKENMETENLLPENLVPETSHRKVIILDGMAVVNQIKKTS